MRVPHEGKEPRGVVSPQLPVHVELADEAWRHILRNHPEVQHYRERILATVREPDVLANGEAGELWALRRYDFPGHGEKYLFVAFRMRGNAAFIITAYITDIGRADRRLRRTIVLWRRPS